MNQSKLGPLVGVKDGCSDADGDPVNDEPSDSDEGEIHRRGPERGALLAARACVPAKWRTTIPRPREREIVTAMRTSHVECGLTRHKISYRWPERAWIAMNVLS